MGVSFANFLQDLPYTIAPLLAGVLITQFFLLRGISIGRRIVAGIVSIVTSQLVVNLLAVLLMMASNRLYDGAYQRNAVFAALIAFFVYILASVPTYFVYKLSILHIKDKERYIKEQYIRYIYVQYILTYYAGRIVSGDRPLLFSILYSLAIIGWIFVFRRKEDREFMEVNFPTGSNSTTGSLLIFEIIMIALLYCSPIVIMERIPEMIANEQTVWLSVFVTVLYLFVLRSNYGIIVAMEMAFKAQLRLSKDSLTEIPTANFFMTHAQRSLKKAHSQGIGTAIIFFDFIDFTYYNRKYSHEQGDKVLWEFARLLERHFPAFNDGMARLDSDHFVVFTTRTKDLTKEILSMKEEMEAEDPWRGLLFRCGIYLISKDDQLPELIVSLENAQKALRTVNAHSAECYRIYDEEIAQAEELMHYVVENIDRAVEEGMLQVFLQPIVDVKTAELASGEALIRWFDDHYGFLPPDKFIPALEKYGLAYKVDQFVIQTVCERLRRVIDAGKEPFPISVNLSRRDFAAADMIGFVEEQIAKYGLERDLLRIEITESAFVEEDAFIQERVASLRKLGYKVWMDDFGSGYSSLNTAGNYEFDGIKIDMLFLRQESERNRALIQAITTTAKEMGIAVLIEGVETNEHFDFVKNCGIDKAQGYLFSKPRPIGEFLED